MTTQPRNLLIIVVDQFRADLLHGALASLVPTPNLDRLAARSQVYRNHHTVTVPCGPSRASLLTGQYAMNHRAVRNGTPLSRHHPTLASELRKLGREPLLFGYTDTQPDPDERAPADPALGQYTHPLPGFTEVLEMRDEAWTWLSHLRAKGYDVPDAQTPEFGEVYRPKDGIPGQSTLYRAEDSDTAFLTDRVLGQLDVRKSHPWSAFVTYIRPHPPYVAPAPYNDMFTPADMPMPVAPFDHPFFDAFHSGPSETGMFWGFNGDQTRLSVDQIALTRASYLGLVAEVDHHIGRILTWLDDTGQTDTTLLALTADHGEMLGDLGLWGKQTMFHQASHVPMMLSGPGIAPGHVDTVSRTIDSVPTLLGKLGGKVPVQMDGQSLDSLSPDSVAMTELELGKPDSSGRFEVAWDQKAEACRACVLQTATHRLAVFAGGQPPMLFDTVEDPYCTINLAGTNAELTQTLTNQLLSHRLQNAARLH